MKKLIIFCSAWYHNVKDRDGWKIYANPQEKDPNISKLPKFGPKYLEVIKAIKPDFVVAINIGCSEQLFDNMVKPKNLGTKYITWSTDSYKHTKRAKTSDLHLSSIPDGLSDDDIFLPLFADAKRESIPFNKRAIEIGCHCRSYPLSANYRQRTLMKIKEVLGTRFTLTQDDVHPYVYLDRILNYQYGINVGVHPGGLPNFRSFEYGAYGIMPICDFHACNEQILRNLFGEHVSLFKNPVDISNLIKPYDPIKLREFFKEKHSLTARLQTIFDKYFDLRF
jgi:hypothetical protein